MTKSKQPHEEDKQASSDPISSAFDRAFSKVAAEFRGDEAASLRSDLLNSASRPAGSTDDQASGRSGDLREIVDTCNFYMTATTFAKERSADPLEALDAKFRKIVGWKKFGSNLNGATDAIVFMRRPDREFVAGSDLRFVALDPTTYRGDAVLDPVAHQKFWDHQMNGRPFSMPFLKSALAIWRKLGVKVDPETTAYMMQMKSVDSETSEAINAAIWSAFNTASYPIDFEAAAFVLASFMHADPLRKQLVSGEAFVEPYGDRTRYGLCKVYTGAAADDEDEHAGNDNKPNQGDLPPPPRYLPIEADNARRQKIEADPTINPDHSGTLNDLKLLLKSDAEKDRVFFGTLNQELRVILDDLLRVAITEIEVEHATVVGVINVITLRMLDICVAIRRDELGRLIW